MTKKNDEIKSKMITRKDFLKNSAIIAGGALFAPSLLVGCTESAPAPNAQESVDIKWDKEADVVCIGGGGGLTGALAAAKAGAKTILLEKAKSVGGTTITSGGVHWVPNNHVMKREGIADSRENGLKYMKKVAEGQVDDEILEAWVDRGPEMSEFVEKNSNIVFGIWDYYPNDYFPEWDGGIPQGRSIVRLIDGKYSGGKGLVDGLEEACEQANVEIMRETPAKRLITRMLEDGTQEVIGVIAETSDGKTINIKANKGVILCCGGYDHDEKLMKHAAYLRGPVDCSSAAIGNVGDGLRMSMAAGAELMGMNECLHFTHYKVPGVEANKNGAPALLAMGAFSDKKKPGSIIVNRFGERFINEASPYSYDFRTYFTWDEVECKYKNLPFYIISVNPIGGDNPPDWVTKADTLRELAVKIGVDPDGLEATVNKFNGYVDNMKDPDFHRGEYLYNTEGNGPEFTLGYLKEGPFYAAEGGVGSLGTSGGPRINKNAQVMSPFGHPIPRLYAAGDCSGIGHPGPNYAGGGSAVGSSMIFSYVGATHAVTLEPWK